ncbi:MAG TPA: cupin domain-containing protein [Candidatus Cloacimonadota bacterium]|nr:cupin domain-containing protein [Candidatus Cloacimonadota bacterium]
MITRTAESETPFFNKNGIQGRNLYDLPEAQIVHMTIEPGKTLFTHTTSVNVAMFILEGEPIIEIGDESRSCPAGTMIESPKNIPHGIKNPSEETVRLLVMKLPKP